MTVAWTTILIIAFLLPGLAFFVGYWYGERYAREPVKSSAVGEVGMAVFMAILIHLVMLKWILHVELTEYFGPLLEQYATPSKVVTAAQLADRAWRTLEYIVIVSVIGFVLGSITAYLVRIGCIAPLVVHKWAHDILRQKVKGKVLAFVMTNMVENNRVMMYAGELEEFYLNENGTFTYVVLKNCSRYFMNVEGSIPTTASRVPLFKNTNTKRPWEHLMIAGENIANVLFDPIGNFPIEPNALYQKELDERIAAAEERDQSATTSKPS